MTVTYNVYDLAVCGNVGTPGGLSRPPPWFAASALVG